jgi:hypothetical protein
MSRGTPLEMGSKAAKTSSIDMYNPSAEQVNMKVMMKSASAAVLPGRN